MKENRGIKIMKGPLTSTQCFYGQIVQLNQSVDYYTCQKVANHFLKFCVAIKWKREDCGPAKTQVLIITVKKSFVLVSSHLNEEQSPSSVNDPSPQWQIMFFWGLLQCQDTNLALKSLRIPGVKMSSTTEQPRFLLSLFRRIRSLSGPIAIHRLDSAWTREFTSFNCPFIR